MRLNRSIKIQLAIFTAVAVVAGAITLFGYIRLPATWFGIGHYTVTVQLPRGGGLYKNGNVTYRGTEVGRITDLHLTDRGVDADLSLRSDIRIPADVDAEVHSVSAIGEQYIALQPRDGSAPPLKGGDVIPVAHTTIPPDINSLLTAVNRGLQAVPHDNVKTVVDESYTAVSGLGPQLARLIDGSTTLAIDARKNLDPLLTLIDDAQPVLDSQAATAESIHAWAAHLHDLTHQLKTHDNAAAGLLRDGGPAADQARHLVERLRPALPLLLANLVSIGQVALTYRADIEQLLVLIPAATNYLSGILVPNANTKLPGIYLDFHLNLNLPAPCTTGYLPTQQMRSPVFEDVPDRTPDDLYCRIPQDAPFTAVRGARNIPCETRPGKRAPTVKMCESDEQYVPLNDGNNWKGDPNATLSGQDIPQLPPGTPPATAPPAAPAPPPIAPVPYDPASGGYVGPDGKVYTQADLSSSESKEKTWQTMLMPPTGN